MLPWFCALSCLAPPNIAVEKQSALFQTQNALESPHLQKGPSYYLTWFGNTCAMCYLKKTRPTLDVVLKHPLGKQNFVKTWEREQSFWKSWLLSHDESFSSAKRAHQISLMTGPYIISFQVQRESFIYIIHWVIFSSWLEVFVCHDYPLPSIWGSPSIMEHGQPLKGDMSHRKKIAHFPSVSLIGWARERLPISSAYNNPDPDPRG